MTSYVLTLQRLGRLCLLLFLLLTGPAMGCGPGRRSGTMRRHRKMTPLVFKQHIPNLSEFTLAASGVAEGRITRGDTRFQDLVRNENSDIVFKDEEGTGADRMMTQRCKDKLNTLAISVMNQWPMVKLRVTEAWDEDSNHAKDSLHYEGRAVDITTSDRDRAKFGMLARLAVQAGFDWVYYESRAHIHCSVKSDSSIATKNGGCFASSGRVLLEGGSSLPMSDLAVGDRVMTMDSSGELVYDDVMMFLHKDEERETLFMSLETESGKRITLTPNHLIHTGDSGDNDVRDISPTYARNVQVGQYLYTTGRDYSLRAERIIDVTSKLSRGVVAPLTTRGTIVVDDVIVSCYAVIESENIAHAVFAPVRFWYSVSDWLRMSTSTKRQTLPAHNLTRTTSKDFHWYADILYSVAPFILPESWLIHS